MADKNTTPKIVYNSPTEHSQESQLREESGKFNMEQVNFDAVGSYTSDWQSQAQAEKVFMEDWNESDYRRARVKDGFITNFDEKLTEHEPFGEETEHKLTKKLTGLYAEYNSIRNDPAYWRDDIFTHDKRRYLMSRAQQLEEEIIAHGGDLRFNGRIPS